MPLGLVRLNRIGAHAILSLFGVFLVCNIVKAQSFDSEKEISHPVKIPAGILKQLRETQTVKSCFENGESVDEFGEKWFRAAKVDLNGDKVADYLVKSDKGCLYGPRAATYWLFLGNSNGFKSIFGGSVRMLTILKTKTAGLRDLQTDTTLMDINRITWKFDGKKYRAARSKTIEVK
jgi:hypothetical protein